MLFKKRNMRSIYKNFRLVIIMVSITIGICFNGCNKKQNTNKDQVSNAYVREYIKIYIDKDTSDYSTTVIESRNPEMPDILVMQFKFKIMNTSPLPIPKDPIALNRCEIIENPYAETASSSIDYKGNPNGFYSIDGKKIAFPIKLYPYNPVSGILKHGQTIDSKTLGFLKTRFKDLKKLKSKEVFRALLENGLNLCNNKSLTEQVFQVVFYSENQNSFSRDVVFPYTNYCK